jgi:hypothetical protein
MFTRTAGRKLMMVMTLTVASYIVFAASGGGSKKAKTVTGKTGTSKASAYKPLSLRSGFSFRGNKLISLEPKKPQYISLQSYVTVTNGGKSYVVPFTHKIGVQPGQIQAPKPANYVEVRLLNININQ